MSKSGSAYKDENIHENITHKPKSYISDKNKKGNKKRSLQEYVMHLYLYSQCNKN